MKKFIIGVVIGVVALAAFLYFGGPKYLKAFGSKTEQAGENLEKYEKELKHTADDAKEAVKDTAESVKETAKDARKAVNKTVDTTKKAVGKTTEKVKEYMP